MVKKVAKELYKTKHFEHNYQNNVEETEEIVSRMWDALPERLTSDTEYETKERFMDIARSLLSQVLKDALTIEQAREEILGKSEPLDTLGRCKRCGTMKHLNTCERCWNSTTEKQKEMRGEIGKKNCDMEKASYEFHKAFHPDGTTHTCYFCEAEEQARASKRDELSKLFAKEHAPCDNPKCLCQTKEFEIYWKGAGIEKRTHLPTSDEIEKARAEGREEVMKTCAECQKVQRKIGRNEGIDAVEKELDRKTEWSDGIEGWEKRAIRRVRGERDETLNKTAKRPSCA